MRRKRASELDRATFGQVKLAFRASGQSGILSTPPGYAGSQRAMLAVNLRLFGIISVLSIVLTVMLTGCESRVALDGHPFSPQLSLAESFEERLRLEIQNKSVGPPPSHQIAVFGSSCFNHAASITHIFQCETNGIVATYAKDSFIRVWNSSTGSLLREYDLSKGRNAPAFLSFSKNADRLAISSGTGGPICIIELATGSELASISHYGEEYAGLAIDSVGKQIACSDTKGSMRLWSVPDETQQFAIQLTSPLSNLAFSVGGDFLAGGNANGELIVVDLALGAVSARTMREGQQARSIAFSPRGDVLAIGSADGRVSSWDWKSDIPPATWLVDPLGILAVGFDEHDQSLWVIGESTGLTKWIQQDENWVTDGEFSGAHISQFASSTVDEALWVTEGTGILRRVNKRNGFSGPYPEALQGQLNDVEFSKDNEVLISASTGSGVEMWRMKDGARIYCFDCAGASIQQVRLTSDHRILGLGPNLGGRMVLHEFSQFRGTSFGSRMIGGGEMWQVADLTRDAVHLAAGSEEGAVVICAIEDVHFPCGNYQEPASSNGIPIGVASLAFSPDGSLLAVALEATPIRILQVPTGALVESIQTSASIPSRNEKHLVEWSSDQHFLAVIQGHSVSLLEVNSGMELAHSAEFPSNLTSVAFSSNSQQLAVGDSTSLVHLFELPTLRELAVFESGRGPVTHLEFSPDNSLVVAGGRNGTLVFLDVRGHSASKNDILIDDAEFAKLWTDLATNDRVQVQTAIARLQLAGLSAVHLLRVQFGKEERASSLHFLECMELELNSPDPAIRDWAEKTLLEFDNGICASDLIATSSGLSPESHARMLSVARRLEDSICSTPECLRLCRSIHVLATIDSVDSRKATIEISKLRLPLRVRYRACLTRFSLP